METKETIITKETRLIDITLGDLLIAISNNSPTVPTVPNVPEDEIGGIELAENITKLAKSTIYSKVSSETIPFMKTPESKKLYFSKRDLEEWIKSSKRFTESDTRQQAIEYITKRKAFRS
jgi:hypothetical protein